MELPIEVTKRYYYSFPRTSGHIQFIGWRAEGLAFEVVSKASLYHASVAAHELIISIKDGMLRVRPVHVEFQWPVELLVHTMRFLLALEDERTRSRSYEPSDPVRFTWDL